MSSGPTADMDPQFFVRVEVPVLNELGQDGHGTYCISGTGYPVGTDLILTARHVAVPMAPDRRDARYPIRIRWMSYPDVGSVGLAADDEALVWQGPGTHDDVALLRCRERPPGVAVPPWPWAPGLPPDGASFRSQGYPRATQFKDPTGGRPLPTQNAFRGTIRRVAEPWFEIVDSAAPKTAEDWQGASGMAIFTDQGIVGVFSAALGLIQGKSQAIPTAPLLEQHPELVALFPDDGFDQHWQAACERAVADIADRLVHAPLLADALRRELSRHLSTAALPTPAPDPDWPRTAAGLLLELDFATFTDIVASLSGQLRATVPPGRAEDGRNALEALRAVTLHLAPLLYDRDLAHRAHVSAQRAQFIELPAAFYAVAELMVAAEEQRPADYQHRKGPTDQDPRGLACLSMAVPELGYDASTEAYCERVEVHLGRKECTDRPFAKDQFLIDLEKFLARFYPPGRPRRGVLPEQRLADWRRGVDLGLSRWSDRDGRPMRLYTVFRPQNADEFHEMRQTAEALHERFPHLRILFLTAFCATGDDPDGDDNPWDRDLARLQTFCQVLPFRPAETPNR